MERTVVHSDDTAKTEQLHDEERAFKYKGVFSQKTVDLVIPFFNESGNITKTHDNSKKLERLFHIKNYIYINNGSKDSTLSELEALKKKYDKIIIVDIKENIGYGNGFKHGFAQSTADFILTNHADQQFRAYLFYLDILDELKSFDQCYSIFPERKGRPIVSILFTWVLRKSLSMILGRHLSEFNGQPKLIDKSALSVTIDKFPDDFSFDLMLYISIDKKKFYPILEHFREVGQSSWNRGLVSKFRLFRSYIKSARKMKKHQPQPKH